MSHPERANTVNDEPDQHFPNLFSTVVFDNASKGFTVQIMDSPLSVKQMHEDGRPSLSDTEL